MKPLRDTGFRKILCLNPLSTEQLWSNSPQILCSPPNMRLWRLQPHPGRKFLASFPCSFSRIPPGGNKGGGNDTQPAQRGLGGPARAEGEGFRFREGSPLPLPATWRLGR